MLALFLEDIEHFILIRADHSESLIIYKTLYLTKFIHETPCYDRHKNSQEKNQMHSISGVIYLILAACLYLMFYLDCEKSAGFRAKDNQNPRAFLEKSTGLASRANAAQQNSFESLPLFIASILMAEYMVVPQSLVMTFGIAYLVFGSSMGSVIWRTGRPYVQLSGCYLYYVQ